MFRKKEKSYIIQFNGLSDYNDLSVLGFEAYSIYNSIKFFNLRFDGFVISSEAFDDFLVQAKLIDRIAEMIAKVTLDPDKYLYTYSQKIQELIISASIPKNILMPISIAFSSLKQKHKNSFFRVTYSHTIPFAYLSEKEKDLSTVVFSEDNFFDSIKLFWANIFTPEALISRIQNKYKGEINTAILVSKLSLPERSGLAWLEKNLKLNKDEIKILARFGNRINFLDEYDEYVIDVLSFEIKKKNIFDQEGMIVLHYKHVNEEVVLNQSNVLLAREYGKFSKLDDVNIEKISRLLIFLIANSKHNLFIEWSIAGGEIFIDRILFEMPSLYTQSKLDNNQIKTEEDHSQKNNNNTADLENNFKESIDFESNFQKLESKNSNTDKSEYLDKNNLNPSELKKEIKIEELKKDEILISETKSNKKFLFTKIKEDDLLDSEEYSLDIASRINKQVEISNDQYTKNLPLELRLIKEKVIIDISNLSTGKLVNMNEYFGVLFDLSLLYEFLNFDRYFAEESITIQGFPKKVSEFLLTYLKPAFSKISDDTNVIVKLTSKRQYIEIYKNLSNDQSLSTKMDLEIDKVAYAEFMSIRTMCNLHKITKPDLIVSDIKNMNDYENLNFLKEKVNKDYFNIFVEILYPIQLLNITDFSFVDGVFIDFVNLARLTFYTNEVTETEEKLLLKILKSAIKKIQKKQKKIYIKTSSSFKYLIEFATKEDLKIVLFNLVKPK